MAGPLEGYATSGHVINAASVYPPTHVSGANGHEVNVDRSTHVSFATGHGANVPRSNALQPANVSGANGHEANVPRSNALQPASVSDANGHETNVSMSNALQPANVSDAIRCETNLFRSNVFHTANVSVANGHEVNVAHGHETNVFQGDALQRANVSGVHGNEVAPFKQPRGRKFPQLIAEFSRVVSLLLPEMPSLRHGKFLTADVGPMPMGSRFLRAEEKRGRGFLCVFGVYHSQSGFVKLAKQLWHPFDELVNLPDRLIQCLFDMLTLGPLGTAKSRLSKLQRWQRWAEELREQEQRIKERMPSAVRRIMGPKRFLLMRKIADEIGWPDFHLHQELEHGFKITGKPNASNVFCEDVQPAILSEEELMKQAKFLKPKLLGRIRAAGANEFTEGLYNITVEEASGKGWLEGPFGPKEVDERLGPIWIPLRRFAVKQKGKLRPIDDCAESRVNDTFTAIEKISLGAMSHIVWAALVLLRHCLHHSRVELRLSNGDELKANVHPEWHAHEVAFKANAFDLKSAYKQLALAPEDVCKGVVSILEPGDGGEVKCFLMRTLPFGAKAAVYHFNRVARFIWESGAICMCLGQIILMIIR